MKSYEKEEGMTDHRAIVCKIISEMLDNPDDYGIYPTTICYDKLEEYIQSECAKHEKVIERLIHYLERSPECHWDSGEECPHIKDDNYTCADCWWEWAYEEGEK